MACWTGQSDAHLLGNNICPWTVILVQVPATPIDSHILSIQLSQPTDCLLMQPYTCQLLITCGDSKHQISNTYYNQHSIKSRYISPTIVPLYTYVPPQLLVLPPSLLLRVLLGHLSLSNVHSSKDGLLSGQQLLLGSDHVSLLRSLVNKIGHLLGHVAGVTSWHDGVVSLRCQLGVSSLLDNEILLLLFGQRASEKALESDPGSVEGTEDVFVAVIPLHEKHSIA
ncbi:uncharacterized protein YALI1_E25107g [Yarrowia lipolytica]|uniref:Uncharacterized protein n=1 Tax=Yarrowia lipolytica TaxID=4952 RepID=A0A1D8NJC5_YARLL|nr:hypothetical protein YALI1_E25107g [Yarrowia lipolytica]